MGKVWKLDKWYKKTVYVIGYIYIGYLALIFVLGFIAGFLGI